MTDIKQLAQQEAEEIFPVNPTYKPDRRHTAHSIFILGAEFGYNQRWIPVTPETMPKEEDAYDNCIPVWHRTRGYQVQLLSYFLKHSDNFTHWQPICPPKS